MKPSNYKSGGLICFSNWFLFLVVALVPTLSLRTFPFYYSGQSVTRYWFMSLVTAAGFLLSAFLREHLQRTVAARSGDANERGPLAGLTGMGVSLALAISCFALTVLAEKMQLPQYVSGILFHLCLANITIGLVHLLPVLPLDGGDAIFDSIDATDPRRAVQVMTRLGFFVATAIFGLGVWQLLQHRPVVGAWLALVALALGWANHGKLHSNDGNGWRTRIRQSQ